MSIPASHIDLIRGLVGDVQLEGSANAYRVSAIPPCAAEQSGRHQGLHRRRGVHQKPERHLQPDQRCQPGSGCLYQHHPEQHCRQGRDQRNLDRNRADLSGRSNPLATLPILKTAVGTSTRATIIPGLADITAKAYSLQMLSDLYLRGESIAAKAKEVLEKKAGPSTGQGPEKCAAVLFAEHADQSITAMLTRIRS